MIEDLKRTLIPRKYKDLLIKSRMNCFKFSLKIFLMFSVILILLNVPNVINMSYEIENFINSVDNVYFKLNYKNDSNLFITKEQITKTIENKSYISNIYKYNFEVLSGDIEFNEITEKINSSSLKNINQISKNKINNFIYGIFLLISPGILIILITQAFFIVYTTILLTFIVLMTLSQLFKLNNMNVKKALKISLLASPILSLIILLYFLLRLDYIKFGIIIYWILIIFIVIELITLKSQQRQFNTTDKERQNFLELNLVRYYDPKKLNEVSKKNKVWYKKAINEVLKYYEFKKYSRKDKNWINYKKDHKEEE